MTDPPNSTEPESDPSSSVSANDEFWLNLATHPHDAFFKEIFSNPEDATAFFRSHLPTEIVSSCDWQSLKVLPGSFVKSTLQQTHSDLHFSVQMQSPNNGTTGEPKISTECFLYLLFEHQSSVDNIMPLRLLSYMVQMFLIHHEQHGLPLPPVIGFVLHQGPDKWTVSQQFCDLFGVPESSPLRPFLPTFEHGLLDLSQFDPALNEQDPSVRIVLQLMKFARSKRLLDFFDWFMKTCLPLLEADELPDRRLETLLLYALHADSNLDIEQLARNIESSKQLKNTTMSVAEKLKAEGRAEGRAEGEARGKACGVWMGRIQMLESLMGKEATPDHVLSGLSASELEAKFIALQNEYDENVKGK